MLQTLRLSIYCLIPLMIHILPYKHIIRYYLSLNAGKDSINLSPKCLCMVDLDFCITYLKNTKFNLVTYLTAAKFFVYPINCCSNYTNIASSTIHAGIPGIFWFIYNNKNFFY